MVKGIRIINQDFTVPKDPIYKKLKRLGEKRPYAERLGSAWKFIIEQKGFRNTEAAANYWAKYDKRSSNTLNDLIQGIKDGRFFMVLSEAHRHGRKIGGGRTENLLKYEHSLADFGRGVLGLNARTYTAYTEQIRENLQSRFKEQKPNKRLKPYKKR